MTIAATFFSTPAAGMPIPAPSEPIPSAAAGFSVSVEAALNTPSIQGALPAQGTPAAPISLLATQEPSAAAVQAQVPAQTPVARGLTLPSQQGGSLTRRPPAMIEETMVQRPTTPPKRPDMSAPQPDKPVLTDGDDHPGKLVCQVRSGPPITKAKATIASAADIPAGQPPVTPPALASGTPNLAPVSAGVPAGAAIAAQDARPSPFGDEAQDHHSAADGSQAPLAAPPESFPQHQPAIMRETVMTAAAAPMPTENAPALAAATSVSSATLPALDRGPSPSDAGSFRVADAAPALAQTQAEPAPLTRHHMPKLPAERIDTPVADAPAQKKGGLRAEGERATRGTPQPPTPPPPLTRLHAPAVPFTAASTGAAAPSETSAAPATAGAPPSLAPSLPAPAASESATAPIATGKPVTPPEAPAAPAAAPSTMAALTSAPDKATPAQPTPSASGPPEPEVAARAGHVGHATGLAIAKRITAGGEELTVRLSPAEFGKVEVRMAFDDRGTLRAVVAAERADALELLRRESADLTRAVMDAGIRADHQSFRFDTRSGGGDAQGFWQRQQQQQRQQSGGHGNENHVSAGPQEPVYQPLRTAGRVNLMA